MNNINIKRGTTLIAINACLIFGTPTLTVGKEYVVTYYGTNALDVIDDEGSSHSFTFDEVMNYFIQKTR